MLHVTLPHTFIYKGLISHWYHRDYSQYKKFFCGVDIQLKLLGNETLPNLKELSTSLGVKAPSTLEWWIFHRINVCEGIPALNGGLCLRLCARKPDWPCLNENPPDQLACSLLARPLPLSLVGSPLTYLKIGALLRLLETYCDRGRGEGAAKLIQGWARRNFQRRLWREERRKRERQDQDSHRNKKERFKWSRKNKNKRLGNCVCMCVD